MDKGGRRHDGRSLSKRTRTMQALASHHICHFGFTVRWDLFGYYIAASRAGSGCPNHANHPKGDLSTLPLPMCLVPAIEKEILQSMADACIGAAVGRNYIFSKLGKFITKAQIAFYTSEPSRPLADGLEKSDTDSLLEFFEATAEISYETLWDVPLVTGETALVSCLNLDRQKGFAEIDHSNDPEFIEPHESAMICRQNPLVHEKSRIIIAVAWANKYNIRTFMLFPEVLHADCTCDSNNTNNHLLTFSCRTSSGKQVVFLRAWIPRHISCCDDAGTITTSFTCEATTTTNTQKYRTGVSYLLCLYVELLSMFCRAALSAASFLLDVSGFFWRSAGGSVATFRSSPAVEDPTHPSSFKSQMSFVSILSMINVADATGTQLYYGV